MWKHSKTQNHHRGDCGRRVGRLEHCGSVELAPEDSAEPRRGKSVSPITTMIYTFCESFMSGRVRIGSEDESPGSGAQEGFGKPDSPAEPPSLMIVWFSKFGS